MSTSMLRRFGERILQINDTPESIALGTAVGMFIAWTPTVGLQMIIMVIVGTVVRANRLAGIAMVYISNPLTVVPIYWLDYLVGCFVMGQEHVTKEHFVGAYDAFAEEVATGPWYAVFTAAGEFIRSQSDIAIAMAVGGTVVGLVLALPTYPITLRACRGHQARRARREALLEERERRREARRQRRREKRKRPAESHTPPTGD